MMMERVLEPGKEENASDVKEINGYPCPGLPKSGIAGRS
jgi:hypothetical protein